MTTVSAKVVADSISPYGVRLTTFQARYPRVVHAQLMTHRQFSRNASSARAIPVEKMIQDVIDDPYLPIYWGKNKKGMQAAEELSGSDLELAKTIWLSARDEAVDAARRLSELGLHKEEANRLLEPFNHIHVIITATELGNFYHLRQDSHAHRLMQALSGQMLEGQKASSPRRMKMEEWHLPYVTDDERAQFDIATCKKLSVARCARVSYATHDGSTPDVEKDCALHDDLKKNLHMSAFEHQATPHMYPCHSSGNFIGWVQYRKEIPNENRPHFFGVL